MGNDNQILNSDPASDKPVTNDDPLILQRRLRKMKYPRIMFTRWNFEECLRECEKILSEETTDDELLSLAADMEFQCRLKLNGLTETVIAGIVKRIEQDRSDGYIVSLGIGRLLLSELIRSDDSDNPLPDITIFTAGLSAIAALMKKSDNMGVRRRLFHLLYETVKSGNCDYLKVTIDFLETVLKENPHISDSDNTLLFYKTLCLILISESPGTVAFPTLENPENRKIFESFVEIDHLILLAEESVNKTERLCSESDGETEARTVALKRFAEYIKTVTEQNKPYRRSIDTGRKETVREKRQKVADECELLIAEAAASDYETLRRKFDTLTRNRRPVYLDPDRYEILRYAFARKADETGLPVPVIRESISLLEWLPENRAAETIPILKKIKAALTQIADADYADAVEAVDLFFRKHTFLFPDRYDYRFLLHPEFVRAICMTGSRKRHLPSVYFDILSLLSDKLLRQGNPEKMKALYKGMSDAVRYRNSVSPAADNAYEQKIKQLIPALIRATQHDCHPIINYTSRLSKEEIKALIFDLSQEKESLKLTLMLSFLLLVREAEETGTVDASLSDRFFKEFGHYTTTIGTACLEPVTELTLKTAFPPEWKQRFEETLLEIRRFFRTEWISDPHNNRLGIEMEITLADYFRQTGNTPIAERIVREGSDYAARIMGKERNEYKKIVEKLKFGENQLRKG